MIKNPQIGQTVFFFEDGEIKRGKINYLFQNNVSKKSLKGVEINGHCYRQNSEIYPTEQLAQKNQKHEISKTLKSLNQEIKQLSKKRENLTSKLAGLIG